MRTVPRTGRRSGEQAPGFLALCLTFRQLRASNKRGVLSDEGFRCLAGRTLASFSLVVLTRGLLLRLSPEPRGRKGGTDGG